MTQQSLFATDPVPSATPEQIRELVDRFGFKDAAVKSWTREHAQTVLAKKQKDEKRAERNRLAAYQDKAHGAAAAASVEDGPQPPNAMQLSARADAAAYIRQELAGGKPESLAMALSYSMDWLTKEELDGLAPLVIAALSVDQVRAGLEGQS